jgi:hypothetical protein
MTMSMRSRRPAPPPLPEGAALEALEAITSPILKTLHKAWAARCAGRPMPARKDLSPRDIKGILPAVFMADVIDGGENFVCTVHGTALSRITGNNAAGRKVTANSGGPLEQRIWSYLRRCAETAAPVAIITQQAVVEAYRFARGENLILPLSDDGVTVNKIIAACDLLLPPSLGGGSSDAILSHVTLN